MVAPSVNEDETTGISGDGVGVSVNGGTTVSGRPVEIVDSVAVRIERLCGIGIRRARLYRGRIGSASEVHGEFQRSHRIVPYPVRKDFPVAELGSGIGFVARAETVGEILTVAIGRRVHGIRTSHVRHGSVVDAAGDSGGAGVRSGSHDRSSGSRTSGGSGRASDVGGSETPRSAFLARGIGVARFDLPVVGRSCRKARIRGRKARSAVHLRHRSGGSPHIDDVRAV